MKKTQAQTFFGGGLDNGAQIVYYTIERRRKATHTKRLDTMKTTKSTLAKNTTATLNAWIADGSVSKNSHSYTIITKDRDKRDAFVSLITRADGSITGFKNGLVNNYSASGTLNTDAIA